MTDAERPRFTIRDPRREGYKAYQDGVRLTDNPYATDDDELWMHEAWDAGWYDAALDD